MVRRTRPGISRFRVRCFASPRNDGVLFFSDTASQSRGTKRPSCARTSRPRSEGAGNAGCPLHPQPRARSVESTRVSHHEFTGTPGIPARDGFNGFLRALPGDRAFLSPSLAELSSANLTPASRRQDHTTSPSASQRVRQCATHVHRIPPRVRDDRDTPHVGRDGGSY
jgi:hypothetical protein